MSLSPQQQQQQDNAYIARMKQDGWIFQDNEYIGKSVRSLLLQNNGTVSVLEGTVTCHLPCENRRPSLWRCLFDNNEIEDVVLSELQTRLDLATKRWGSFASLTESQNQVLGGFVSRCESQRLEAVAKYVEINLLPQLCIVAALEEGLHAVLQQGGGGVNHGTTSTSNSTTTPRYYSTLPSHYMMPSTQHQEQHDSKCQLSPSNLAQRIRLGAQLAWNYYSNQILQEEESNVRRSTRLPTVAVPKPQPVQRGGRVAMYLLDMVVVKHEENDTTITTNGAVNPYLIPSRPYMLDWLGKRGKSTTGLHIQHAICSALQKGLAPQYLEAVDKMVLSHNNNNNNDSDIILECTSGDKVGDLPLLEVTSFGKCRFALVTREEQQQRQLQNEDTQLAEAEAEFKRKKAWASWRFKSIHGGYAKWPSWEGVVNKKWNEMIQVDGCATAAVNVVESSAGSGAEQQQQVVATTENTAATTETATTETVTTTETTTTEVDLALATSLQQDDAMSGTRRRTTRQSQGGQPVFYGGQSTMTQKQLLDTVVRMLKEHPQALVKLMGLVAEESTNPLQRVRVAMGKLLWKYHVVSVWNVSSVASDELLLKRPLWVAATDDSANHNVAAIIKTEQQENDSKEKQQLDALVSYLSSLHQTELALRRLVLQHLTSIPLSVVATAADERPGSLEAMDGDFDFENSGEWSRAGHDYLQQKIYRPAYQQQQQQDAVPAPCRWYEIVEYCPSVLVSQQEGADGGGDASTESPCREVERRMRFWAEPVLDQNDGEEMDQGANEALILTQAQVRAGLEAAKLQQEQDRQHYSNNPFANNVGANVTLEPVGGKKGSGDEQQVHYKVVGHDTLLVASEENPENGNSPTQVLEHRILILPDGSASTEQDGKVGPGNGEQPQDPAMPSVKVGSSAAFWARVSETSDGTLICRPLSNTAISYKIGQSDYHPSSRAFQACESIVDFLKNHNKSGVFMEPVDPVALNIPEYFDIVKRPMDISTLESNLEKGVYSKIPPGGVDGQGPVERMLNGPFKDDVVLIFDNAMLFNPPTDWIHTTAASIKKSVLRKIETVSRESHHGGTVGGGRRLQEKRSVYVDEDSDVDMYIYESDRDDEDFGGRRPKRKRAGRSVKKEDCSTRAMEHAVRLQRTLSESAGIGGPFADLPMHTNASSYTLPGEWSCRHKAPTKESIDVEKDDKKRTKEIMELLALQREVEENERASLRRSTRSHDMDDQVANADTSLAAANVEYFLSEDAVPPMDEESFSRAAGTRSTIETARELMHESYYARLFQDRASGLAVASLGEDIEKETYGLYVNDSFPPFLGRVVPSSSDGAMVWEIRSPYAVAALRWVIRGLVQSGHLSELEPLLANDSPLSTGIILPNNVYIYDESLEPFDILDVREMQRRRRANNAGEDSDESEEFEMSEYEKLRAERVARNAERLKALGLT